MARANETERKRDKEKEEKGFKRKSQSGVQWYEAQREVTSEVVRGDCSRNPSDGRDHACLHARDNDAARRRLFLYSRFSLFLARPFFSFSSSIFFFVLFSLFLIFFFLPSTPTPSPPPAPDSTRHCVPSRATNGRMGRGALNI